MISPEPHLNHLVEYLGDMRVRLEAEPGAAHRFVFSRKALAEARESFAHMIRAGESRLHRLCALLCDTFFPEHYELESVVVGEVPATGERFVLSGRLAPQELDLFTDLDLGNRQVEKLRYFDGETFSRAQLVANFVEYQPLERNVQGIYKIGSRIKAEEEIWNKVVDEIFDLDGLVRRDKKLRRLSRYVKDVFGLKIVVGTKKQVALLHKSLLELQWTPEFLARHNVPVSAHTRQLRFIETKDYLGEEKKSGWSALKSVVAWDGTPFEIQVQPLRNHLRERERLTRESHVAFKNRREALRNEVALSVPLFGFYRDLLQWLFRTPDAPPPEFEGVTLELRD